MKNEGIQLLHIGLSGFPNNSASFNRCMNMLQALLQSNEKITIRIINFRAIHPKDFSLKLNRKITLDGIENFYTSLSPYKSNNFLIRNLSKVAGRVGEVFLLLKLKIKGQASIAFLYLPTDSFITLLYYRLISKILNIKIIINRVEFFPAFENRKNNFCLKINDYLFDNYYMHFVDGIIPISNFLLSRLKIRNLQKPYLKVPAIFDFSSYSNIKKSESCSFVFCGSAGYIDIIDFIIKSFDLLNDKSFQLILISNGDGNQLRKVASIIKKSKKCNLIKLYTNLGFEELLGFYKSANALLIPMRPGLQDEARFPQKIAEYTASGNPIISTNYGEVKYYFNDQVNALIAESFEVNLFSIKMKFVIDNPEESRLIGERGKKIGLEYFDIHNYSERLLSIINSVILKN